MRMTLSPCPGLHAERSREGRWQKEATSHQRWEDVIYEAASIISCQTHFEHGPHLWKISQRQHGICPVPGPTSPSHTSPQLLPHPLLLWTLTHLLMGEGRGSWLICAYLSVSPPYFSVKVFYKGFSAEKSWYTQPGYQYGTSHLTPMHQWKTRWAVLGFWAL